MGIAINEFFDKIFVLNLKKDSAKRQKIISQFNEFNIKFDFFNAINGYSSEFEREWWIYEKRPKCTHLEHSYNKKFIESQGALGYLKSMESLLMKALQNKYESILVFDDDIILIKDFHEKFQNFISSIRSKNTNWKMILLGASQYNWKLKVEEDYYHPVKLKTFGSFATAYHSSIFYELLIEVQKMLTPFDNLPVGTIYEKYSTECFVSYPNIVIADVSNSIIRSERNMDTHSQIMRWNLEEFY